jgi:putative transposase
MRRAFKYRLYPNADEARELGIMLETHRRLYNAALAQRKDAWEKEKKAVYYGDQSAWYKKERETNEFFARTNFSSAQATLRRLEKSFQNFFRRVKGGEKPGYPRFKARDRYESVEFPSYGDGIRLLGNRLRIQHVGRVKVKLHRPIEGEIKTVSLKHEGDHWYAVFSCDLGEILIPKSALPEAGIDVGLERFLTDSEGGFEENPRYLKKELPALRRAQRAVSRKKKGGKNRTKARRKVRRIHARVRNLRREHHYQVSERLVHRYGFIAAERLSVSNMLKNRRLSRAISDAGWSRFLGILKHKAEKAGASVVEVDPRGTSQECSGCGKEVRKDLSERLHSCPHCDLSLHRDHNAALNVLARARRARTGPVGLNAAAG